MDDFFDVFDNDNSVPIEPVYLTPSCDIAVTDCFVENYTQHKTLAAQDYVVEPLVVPSTFAKKNYDFELDTFQKMSLAAIERNENLLISAHTSAGKTVIAEYAIAHCLFNNQRCIYTSPIKALSNQKYRELQALSDANKLYNPQKTCENNENTSKDTFSTSNQLNHKTENSNTSEIRHDGQDDFDNITDQILQKTTKNTLSSSSNTSSAEQASVGLLTGDVTINPNASVLVMTTEILRNMLYKGNTLLKEVNYIIFDEIHYLKDLERGVVWEEAIILAPSHFRFVFLSATIPNAIEFGSWIVSITKTCCHLVSTEKRPTPLEHYLWVRDRPYKILYDKQASGKSNESGPNVRVYQKDENVKTNISKSLERPFSDNINDGEPKSHAYIEKDATNDINYETKDHNRDSEISESPAESNLHDYSGKEPHQQTETFSNSKNLIDKSIDFMLKDYLPQSTHFDAREFVNATKNVLIKRKIDESDLLPMIKYLKHEKLLPSIIFAFSRKECETYALGLNEDFITLEEKDKISQIFNAAISNLNEEEQNLELIQKFLPILQRGIGIHHAGLLPIIKEIVEILFQENLLKILFATETFSIGLNMPAKSVVFTSLKKFDGETRRYLRSGEYIQMSGRAGRRNLDKKGIVFSFLNEHITFKQGKSMFSGKSDKLNSAFRLSYNMILNLMRIVDVDPVFLIKRSFFYFQSQNNLRETVTKIQKMKSVIAEKKIGQALSFTSQNNRGVKDFSDFLAQDIQTQSTINDEHQSSTNDSINVLLESTPDNNVKKHKNTQKFFNKEQKYQANSTYKPETQFPSPSLDDMIFSDVLINSDLNSNFFVLDPNIQKKLISVQIKTTPQLANLIKGYGKLILRRNMLIFDSQDYRQYMQKGRILGVFISNKTNNFRIEYAKLRSYSENLIVVEFFCEKALQCFTISKQNVLTVYDSLAMHLKAFREAIKSEPNRIDFQVSSENSAKADEQELLYINCIVEAIEAKYGDFLFLESCLSCGNGTFVMDCLYNKCLENSEIEERVESSKALDINISLRTSRLEAKKDASDFNNRDSANRNRHSNLKNPNNFDDRYERKNAFNARNLSKNSSRTDSENSSFSSSHSYSSENSHHKSRNDRFNRNKDSQSQKEEYTGKKSIQDSDPNIRTVFDKMIKLSRNQRYLNMYEDLCAEYTVLKNIYHLNQCKQMIQVLRRLNYYDKQITIKGKVACEISTANELILSELIFTNKFLDMSIESILALLSCLIFHETDNNASISAENKANYEMLKSLIQKLINIMNDCGLEIKLEDWIKKYSWELMDTTSAWASGKSFTAICNMSDIFEGSIIRAFRRLEELLKQLCAAAREIGNSELENIFASGILRIKRDIVFSSSLYV